jgi:hypothetical protein
MPPHFGNKFTQKVNEAQIYFTHYALFEEPDDSVPAGVYIDAATGAPTQELVLTAPIYQRVWTRNQPPGDPNNITTPTEASRTLPYFVDPPGFPPLPAPPQIVGLIASLTGAPEAVVQANTEVLLVAIGQFLAEGTTTGKITGDTFEIQKTARFQVRIRTGFIFNSPSGPSGNVGVLTGYLDMGTLHQLIQLPPPPDPSQIVVYDWKAPMTLSTANSYVRQVATEPKPVADAFPAGLTEINFQGEPIDNNGNYTVVGFAKPSDVQFTAPPELEQFLFGTNNLTDVEFALLEEGTLVPL